MFFTFLNAKAPLSSLRVKFTRVESAGLSSITVEKGSSVPVVSVESPLMVILERFWAKMDVAALNSRSRNKSSFCMNMMY